MLRQLPPTVSLANLPRTIEAKVPLKVVRDLKNRAMYGRDAPQSDECVFVDPDAVRFAYSSRRNAEAPVFRRSHSGLVKGGDWDLSVTPLKNGTKEIACIAHFRDGVPWEETGIYDYLMADIHRKGTADGMRSLAELEERYADLDQLYAETRELGRFRRRHELDSYFRREHGAIYIHIARDGTPLKAGGGVHRLIIARILGLRRVPAQLGVIHAEAVKAGLMDRLRHPD
ncbi:hypothetical protein [Tropicimonas isoalkanivorans]|uniref:ParB-like nuclease domain-containing protein n=1 Tax=Tropicimonas isoalkanivorans TaxID=441112 RepID=A0A1I1G523_9RHOB|nr:hypothetical protein [Tropicimonas isoalkanivorans]SFC06704.1 hypothetical protein SAMN04488094_102422 [Tropicimonas isoalkanivorans]